MTAPIVKRVVCLANSRKLSGRCIAGKELQTDAWIRPVSDRQHEEVSEHERQYEDGQDPKVLDVIDVPLLRAKPNDHQPENWLLHPDYYWVKVGSFEASGLPNLVDSTGTLWVNDSSSSDGTNDRVKLPDARQGPCSLLFLRVASLVIDVLAPGMAYGNPKRKVKGEFEHDGSRYRLTITDPAVEKTYLAQPDGRHAFGERYLTISLGEPFEGYCYKLIAAVIPAS